MTLITDICNALINTKFTATVRGGQGTGRLGTDDFQITFDILLTRQLLLYMPSEKLHFPPTQMYKQPVISMIQKAGPHTFGPN